MGGLSVKLGASTRRVCDGSLINYVVISNIASTGYSHLGTSCVNGAVSDTITDILRGNEKKCNFVLSR